MLIDLSHLNGLLKIAGRDAGKLLQGQLTIDVNKLTTMHHALSALCNPQGRIISFFRIFKHEAAYFLCMPHNMVALTQHALKKYAVFYQVELADVSNDFAVIGVLDPLPSSLEHTLFIQPYLQQPYSYLLLTTHEYMQKLCILSSSDTILSGKLLEIKAGIPQIYPETSGKFLPHEINLHHINAIDFDKGCYTGQEIIARMHYRGKLKKHLYHSTISSSHTFVAGTALYDATENPRGIIVDSCLEKDDQYHALICADESMAPLHTLFLEQNPQAAFTILSKSDA